jgi:hypothetical protein
VDTNVAINIAVAVIGNIITAAGLIFTLVQMRRGDAEAKEKDIERMTRIEVHVETLWDFHIRRSMVEATNKGIGTLNSPFIMNEDAAHEIGGNLKDELLAWYHDLPDKDSINERDLFIRIEGAFGDRLIRDMCIPHGIQEGTCILIAIALIKGESGVGLEFPSVISSRTPEPPAPPVK